MAANTFTSSQSLAYQGIRQVIRTRSHLGAVLSAPAGAGKTYLTAAMVGDLIAAGHRVAVTAPTNKAVAVLSEKAPHAEAMTTHAMLGLRLKKTEAGTYRLEREGEPKTERFSVIVVDESSMLNADLYGLLLERRHGAFLLFVGDAAQLPPVISGLERSPAFDDPHLAQFQLTEIVRQAKGSPIITLATAIRAHEGRFPIDALRDYGSGDSVRIVARQDVVKLWHDGARILAWRNETVQAYNAALHRLLHSGADTPFCPGERVILQRQHETSAGVRLHTSAEGVVTGIQSGAHPAWPGIPAWRVSLLMDDGTPADEHCPQRPEDLQRLIGEAWQRFRKAKLARDEVARKRWSATAWALIDAYIPLRLAYASTVHKAQGSTFTTAIVDVQDLNGMKPHREFNKLLYTAVTRPSDSLLLATEVNP